MINCYVLVHAGMYRWFKLGMLSCWIRGCSFALLRALYWRPVYLITLIQAQECFNQPGALLPLEGSCTFFLARGVAGAVFFSACGGGGAASSAGTCGGAGSMIAAGGGSSTLLATTASSEGAASGTGAALATNLQIKGLATGRRISCGSSRRNR